MAASHRKAQVSKSADVQTLIVPGIDELAAELKRMTNVTIGNPGPEWCTAAEVAAKMGCSHQTSSRWLNAAVDKGMFEKESFVVKVNGFVRRVTHYRKVRK